VLVWLLFVVVFLCMPLYYPVSVTTMNYTSVIFVGFVLIATIYWFAGGRKQKYRVRRERF